MDEKEIYLIFLIIVFFLVTFIILNCKNKKYNENFSMQLPMPQNQENIKEINQYHIKKQISNQDIKPSNQINVKEAHPYNIFPKEKKIVDCVQAHNKEYKHSQKQKEGPIEYTNNKTHIGPSNNFHQCFNNGDKNISNDLGWRELELKYKTNRPNYQKGLNPDNNLNNPAAANYLANLPNLENLYF